MSKITEQLYLGSAVEAKDKKWLRPPLMPVEVMQTLSSGALRNEDKELISEKLPMPWKASAE